MESMDSTTPSAPAGASGSYRRIDGRREFRAAVVEAIERAADTGSLAMTWCDANFSQWPLADPVLLAALVRWGLPRRRLTLLGHDFQAVGSLYPAFTRWRQQWSHVVECRELCDVAPSAVPTLLWVPGLVGLKVVDTAHFRGIESDAPDDMNRVRESIEAVSQRSQPGFPATVLGL
jgi:hypothetical protein